MINTPTEGYSPMLICEDPSKVNDQRPDEKVALDSNAFQGVRLDAFIGIPQS
jgi:hypothetical protein